MVREYIGDLLCARAAALSHPDNELSGPPCKCPGAFSEVLLIGDAKGLASRPNFPTLPPHAFPVRYLSGNPAAAWATLGLLSGLNLLNYLDRYVMSAVLTPLQADLRLNDADGGALASAFMLGYFLTAPVFGYLGDRYPRKYLMLTGVMIWSLATVATGFAQNFAEMFAIRIVVGVGEACFVTLSPSWISDLFAATRRNTAITFFYVAIPFGSAIGFAIGGKFAELGLWRDAFFWVGLPGLLFAFSLLMLREPQRGEADGLAGEVTHHPKPNFGEIGRLLLNYRYNLVAWGYTALVFAIGAFGVWGPKFLYEFHGLTLSQANTISAKCWPVPASSGR